MGINSNHVHSSSSLLRGFYYVGFDVHRFESHSILIFFFKKPLNQDVEEEEDVKEEEEEEQEVEEEEEEDEVDHENVEQPNPETLENVDKEKGVATLEMTNLFGLLPRPSSASAASKPPPTPTDFEMTSEGLPAGWAMQLMRSGRTLFIDNRNQVKRFIFFVFLSPVFSLVSHALAFNYSLPL